MTTRNPYSSSEQGANQYNLALLASLQATDLLAGADPSATGQCRRPLACKAEDGALVPGFYVAAQKSPEGNVAFEFGIQEGSVSTGISWTLGADNFGAYGSVDGVRDAGAASDEVAKKSIGLFLDAVSFNPEHQTIVTSLGGSDRVVEKGVLVSLAIASGLWSARQ